MIRKWIIFNILFRCSRNFTKKKTHQRLSIWILAYDWQKAAWPTSKSSIWWPKDFSTSSAIDQIYLVERDGMRIIHQKRHLFICCKSQRVRYNRNHNHNHTRTECNIAHPNCYRPLVATHQCCNNMLLVVFGRSFGTCYWPFPSHSIPGKKKKFALTNNNIGIIWCKRMHKKMKSKKKNGTYVVWQLKWILEWYKRKYT